MPEDVYTSGVDWDGRQCRAINLVWPGNGSEGLGKIALDKKTSVGDLSTESRARM